MNTQIKQTALFFGVLSSLLIFQNCGSHMSFSQNSVSDKFGSIDCVTFSTENGEDCLSSTNGLLGQLYYLLDKTNGSVIASQLYDKNDVAINFDGTALNSVNVILNRGHSSSSYILMPDVSVPAVAFTSGFEVAPGQYLKDKNGKVLIEAFAIDVKGFVQLASGMSAGAYEIGVLSDDGSILDVDKNGDGSFDFTVDNDGYHSPKLKCSRESGAGNYLKMEAGKRYAVRLRYYQGPRTTIAATIVMRLIQKDFSGLITAMDSDCGYADSGSERWFGQVSTAPGYVPDYSINSKFGKLLSRGWFVPEKEMYVLPDSL